MTQRNTRLTCTLPVAILIPACLSFAQAAAATGRNGFEAETAAGQLPRGRRREMDTPASGWWLDLQPSPSSIGHEPDAVLRSMAQSRGKRER